MTKKKVILYAAIIVILAVLLILGFKAPQTSRNKKAGDEVTESSNSKTKNDSGIKAEAEDTLDIWNGEFSNNKEDEPEKDAKKDSLASQSQAIREEKKAATDLKEALFGFPFRKQLEPSSDAYRAYKRNGLVELKEWDEAQVEGVPPLQVIGQGARAYFKVESKDAKEAVGYYANSNINVNSWRYEGSFKEDIVNHKPDFKDNSLYAGDEKVERGKHISYALSSDKYFGTVTFFQPRFDDGFIVMFVDVMKN